LLSRLFFIGFVFCAGNSRKFFLTEGAHSSNLWGTVCRFLSKFGELFGILAEETHMSAKKLNLVIGAQVPIRERVYSVIRNHILNGRLTPGERLKENRLAEEIKTSRTPVREALHLLEKEGLLESIPRVGYRVKPLLWDEVEEICAIRAVNETLAAQWAMRRMTQKELDTLEKIIIDSEKEVKDGDPKAFVERDAEFHETLAKASGSRRLIELCQMLRRHMLRYRIESLYRKETAFGALKGHRRILECLRRKDEQGLDSAVRDHLEFAKQSIQTQIHWDREG
jgi:DNA-binding GntR family transcriptional regulator